MSIQEGIKTNQQDRDVKTAIISHLLDEGYGTYAERFKDFPFIVTSWYNGQPVPTAQMDADGVMCINPGFFNISGDNPKEVEKVMDRLSVLCRHEMLHYLLTHIVRMKEYLQRKFPNIILGQHEIDFSQLTPDELTEFMAIRAVDNKAADWELSEQGYDDHDKEVVRGMAINGEVIGGLILEDDHPEWLGLTYEEIMDRASAEILPEVKAAQQAVKDAENKPKVVMRVSETSHSPEYTDVYNKVISKFDNDKYSDADLATLLADLLQNGEIDID